MNETLIYEEAMYSDKFRNDILCGKYSDDKLSTLIKENKLNSYELKIVAELAPNLAQQQNNQQQPVQNTQPSQQVAQPQTNQNPLKSWNDTVEIIKKGKLISRLANVSKSFQQDQYVTEVTSYITKALTELNTHLKGKYSPQKNAAPQQQQNIQQN